MKHPADCPLCALDGCDRPAKVKGYCQTHYVRLWRYGRVTLLPKVDTRCAVDGCEGKRVAKGYCRKHYWRVRLHGTTEKVKRSSYVRTPEMRAATGRRATTHGMTNTPTYQSWRGMLERTRNPDPRHAYYYTARGITVCDRWNPATGGSFLNFLEDMGERPEGMTLDRTDNDGNYEPANCRWATWEQQSANRRPKQKRPVLS